MNSYSHLDMQFKIRWGGNDHCSKAIVSELSVGVFTPTAMDCIKISLQNLSRLVDTLPAPEVSEVVNLVLGFVKDSYPISSALFLEFETGEGYPLLLKVLLR